MKVSLTKKDFIIKPYKADGKGGQHRNKTESAIRITHIESGIVAQAEEDRNQHKNKRVAWERMMPKLLAYYEKKLRSSEVDKIEKEDRVIRTYNDKRNQVKDHRTGVVLNMKKVLDGDIIEFTEASLKQDIENIIGT